MALDIRALEAQYRTAVLAQQQQQRAELEGDTAATPAPADEADGEAGEAEEDAAVTIETFETAMERLRDQQTQMEALRDYEDVAVMRLSVSDMKRCMLPVPQACLDDLKVCNHDVDELSTSTACNQDSRKSMWYTGMIFRAYHYSSAMYNPDVTCQW